MDGDGWLTISNEFTTVQVREVRTRNGSRLEIRSPKLGSSIRLDPLELESLTWQDGRTFFSELLRTPYGPEADVEGIRPMSELFPNAFPPASPPASAPGQAAVDGSRSAD